MCPVGPVGLRDGAVDRAGVLPHSIGHRQRADERQDVAQVRPVMVVLVPVFMLMFMMGLTFTASTTLALNSERDRAGAASALLGTVCFLAGGIVSPLVGVGNILHSTAVIFVAGAAMSSIFAIRARRAGNMR